MRSTGRIVPVQMFDRCILRLRAAGIERLQAFAQVVDKPGIGPAIARRLHDFVMPLDEPMRIGEGALLLTGQRCWQQEDLSLYILWSQFTALDLWEFIPERGGFIFKGLPYYHPFQIGQRHTDHVRVVAANDRILPHEQQSTYRAIADG